MATVKGIWTFKDVLTDLPASQDVNFISGNKSYVGFFIDDGAFSPSVCSLCYKYLDETLTYGYGGDSVYFYDEYEGNVYWDIGYPNSYKTIDFGETEQTVSDGFYAWLVENAVTSSNNIKINITENGTTTLATAGKYCDRNIDVIVNVPSNDEELEEQKAITNGIIEKTISGEYVNNDLTFIGSYAFFNCKNLESICFPNVEKVDTTAFSACSSLKRADFTNLGSNTGIYGSTFKNCTSLEVFIIRGATRSRLSGANAFEGSAIANGTGFIYVPDNLVDDYKRATNWSAHASQIKPISELEE